MPFPSLAKSQLKYGSVEFVISHSVTGWPVSIILAIDKVICIVVLELLLKRQRIEFATQGKLAIDFILADIEVLHIEESYRSFSDRQEGFVFYTNQHV